MQNFMTGSGKSSAFFFFTQDLKYAIKTINRQEFLTLTQRLLPKYFQHIQDKPDSLIARILGVFSVRASHMNKIYIIMMQNLLDKTFVKRIYDLKGSTFKRSALSVIDDDQISSSSQSRKSLKRPRSPSTILKDLDILSLEDWICLCPQLKKKFLNSVYCDSQMLASCNLMDYSLLVARFEFPNRCQEQASIDEKELIQEKQQRRTRKYMSVKYMKDIAKNQQTNMRIASPTRFQQGQQKFNFDISKTSISNENYVLSRRLNPHKYPHESNCKFVYSFAIIDYLQNYNFRKQMEYQGRKLTNPKICPSTLSVQEPEAYAKRFFQFMRKITRTKDQLEDQETKAMVVPNQGEILQQSDKNLMGNSVTNHNNFNNNKNKSNINTVSQFQEEKNDL